jgi:hypothetical protein
MHLCLLLAVPQLCVAALAADFHLDHPHHPHLSRSSTQLLTQSCTPLQPFCFPQNLNWVWPLQRQEFTLIALINTGSLWLYEGPRSNSPSPLLVSRLISRGVAAMALPDNFLVQPLQYDNTLPPQLLPESFQCGKLDAGAMRPPGFWDGGVSSHALLWFCTRLC